MLLNVKKMHVGRNNRSVEYNVGIHILEKTTNEKDLGVHVDNELKFHLHSSNAIKKEIKFSGPYRAHVHCEIKL